jgi:heptosyltransferase-3
MVESTGNLAVESRDMRLLFVKLKHIGDALIMTPMLTAVRRQYPQAQIWVVVRKGCEGILSGCTAIDRIVTSAPAEARRRSTMNWVKDVKLAWQLRQQGFDHAFELGEGDRGRWLAGLSGARIRCLAHGGPAIGWWWRQRFNAFSDTQPLDGCHRAERDYRIVNGTLPLGVPLPPLAFARERTQPWAPAETARDFILVHPGTRWHRKRWPVEHWIELCRHLQQRCERIILSAGPDAEELKTADEIHRALGGGTLNSAGQLSWAQLAGLLYRAKLFVGVDTAAMHLAAACQTPGVALFGPTREDEWRPWQAPHVVVTQDFEPAHPEKSQVRIDFHVRKVSDITVAQVLAGCHHLLASSRGPG